MYIYKRKAWPNFTWDQAQLANLLAATRHLQGRLLGSMNELGFNIRNEATLQILTQDVIKTSEIEGEKLDVNLVRSSIAKRLGFEVGSTPRTDRNIEGIVEIMLDATKNYMATLTKERLCHWHAALFPTGRSGLVKIAVGRWRPAESGAMQVVSGPLGREKIHYEAPEHHELAKEMRLFLKWFNAPTEIDAVIKSAIAHFWFVTIHPFDDGNGRIARAIADMQLARAEKSEQRFFSMSKQIQHERHSYYQILEQCQKGSLDITPWIKWFLNCMSHAIAASEDTLKNVLLKTRFWRSHLPEHFNERQRLIINRLLDGFEGNLNSSKWAKITKCSQDTALRDITNLLEQGILIKNPSGGRSTSYQLRILQEITLAGN